MKRLFDLDALIFCHLKLWEKFTDFKLWLLTALFAPAVHSINKYLFNDWGFIKWLLILMFLDLFSGLWRSKLEGNLITSKGLRDTVTKFIQYGVFLIVIHVLMNFEIDGHPVRIFSWMDDAAYTFLMVIEAKSIWENITKVRPKLDLNYFIERITFRKK